MSTNAAAGATSLVHPPSCSTSGIVVEDLSAALTELSSALGVTWKGGDPEVREVWLGGTARTLEMRIAHSVQEGLTSRVIEAIPGTPGNRGTAWASTTSVIGRTTPPSCARSWSGVAFLACWGARGQDRATSARRAVCTSRCCHVPDARTWPHG